jgi:hypothetical protein
MTAERRDGNEYFTFISLSAGKSLNSVPILAPASPQIHRHPVTAPAGGEIPLTNQENGIIVLGNSLRSFYRIIYSLFGVAVTFSG